MREQFRHWWGRRRSPESPTSGEVVSDAESREPAPSLADEIAVATIDNLPALRARTLAAMAAARKKDRAEIGSAYDRQALQLFAEVLGSRESVLTSMQLYNHFVPPDGDRAVIGGDSLKELRRMLLSHLERIFSSAIREISGIGRDMNGLAERSRALRDTFAALGEMSDSTVARLQEDVRVQAERVIEGNLPEYMTAEQLSTEYVTLADMRTPLSRLVIPEHKKKTLLDFFENRAALVYAAALDAVASSQRPPKILLLNTLFARLRADPDRANRLKRLQKTRDCLHQSVGNWEKNASNLSQCEIVIEAINDARFIDGTDRARLLKQMQGREVILLPQAISRLADDRDIEFSATQIRTVLDAMKSDARRAELEKSFDLALAGVARPLLREAVDPHQLVELRPILIRGGNECRAILTRLDEYAKAPYLKRIATATTLPQLARIGESLAAPGYPFTPEDKKQLGTALDDAKVAFVKKEFDRARGGLVQLGAALRMAARYLDPDSVAYGRVVQIAEREVARYVSERRREISHPAALRTLNDDVAALPLSAPFLRNIERVILQS